jgi:hypothetical protein
MTAAAGHKLPAMLGRWLQPAMRADPHWRHHFGKPAAPIDRLAVALARRLARGEKARVSTARARKLTQGELADVIVGGPSELTDLPKLFGHLRWGGLLGIVGPDQAAVHAVAGPYLDHPGFLTEQDVHPVRAGRLGLPIGIPGLDLRGFAAVVRKVELIQPGEFTERFTHHVYLQPDPAARHGMVVVKEIPTRSELLAKLRSKYPSVDAGDLEKRVHKLVDHVFPTFLTREAAILQILDKHLPEAYRHRVPKAVRVDKDDQGFVRRLTMDWLRIGGEPLDQLQFARQAAEMLQVLHEQARVMHLDLRLDNMVITEAGVCFIDFGSSVRVGEQLEQSPMLSELFRQMMRTSQIQRMLGAMLEHGHVTNQAIAGVHGKTDKIVDAFYLAVQIAKPHGNPDLVPLIHVEPGSEIHRALDALTAAILRPKNPAKAEFKTAGDILRGLDRIQRRVASPARG